MREIKFRAWDKKKEQMVGVLEMKFLFEEEDGIMVEGYCDCNAGILQDHESHKHTVFPEDLEVMQYTGLKDKNGKEIYEGDIVKVWNEGEYLLTQKVEWAEIGGYFCDEDTGNCCPALGDEDLQLEVIGNVHENPELLK